MQTLLRKAFHGVLTVRDLRSRTMELLVYLVGGRCGGASPPVDSVGIVWVSGGGGHLLADLAEEGQGQPCGSGAFIQEMS